MGRALAPSLAATVALLLACPGGALASGHAAGGDGGDVPVRRVAGATRVDTAVEVARAGWPSASYALLATATDFPDALAGTALADRLDAPLLLTEPGRLPRAVADELVRLGVREVVVLGGSAAVSGDVVRAVGDLPGTPHVRRVSGRDRWETAARAAAEAAGDAPAAGAEPTAAGAEVAVASGHVFADALAAAALSGDGARVPVLLAQRSALPGPTVRALDERPPQLASLVGGAAVLGEEVRAAVAERAGAVRRLSGPDRFATSAAVVEAALARAPDGPRPLVVATGVRFPDALSAAALAARLDGVLLLVPPRRLTDGLDALLRTRRDRLTAPLVVGGEAAVSAHVASEIGAALAGRPRPVTTVTTPGGFHGTARALPEDVRQRIQGSSWRPGCPVRPADLAYLELTHRDLTGGSARGELVVHERVAADILTAFAALHDAGFAVARMRLVDDYGADDDASMDANNTHAFNCRTVAGTSRWSEHAYGTAVDVNPVQNPYVQGDHVAPEAGRAYLDRGDVRPGMIVRPGPVVEAFAAIGWGWGGDWRSARDYHHFSASGR